MKIIVELETDKLENQSLVQVVKQITDPNDLDKLSRHDDASVRMEVAENKNTSAETLNFLSKDENYMVKYVVASNKNTPEEVLYRLVNEENFIICEQIAQRERLSERIKVAISKRE